MNTPELTLESIDYYSQKVENRDGNVVPINWEDLRDLLSLARLQIESQGVTEGKLAPSTTRSACAPPTHSDVVPEKEPTITVCDKCLLASCLQGVFLCQESAHAGTVKKTRGELEALGLENPCYWAADRPPIHTEESPSDGEMLDWLESQSKASSTGISFDYVRYVEDGQVIEKGYRFMRRHFLGERKDTLRSAIKSAMEQEK